MATVGNGFVKLNIKKSNVKDIKTTTSSATRSHAYSTSVNTHTSVFTPTTRPVATHTSNSYSNRPTAANVNRQLGGGSAAYNVMGQKGINPWAPNNGITGFGQQLNANRTPAFIYDNYDYGLQPYQDKEMSTMDWIMAGSMMLGQALKGAADITAAVKDIKNSGNNSANEKLQEQWGDGYDMTFFNNIKSGLKGVKNLSDFNTKETEVANKINEIKTGYIEQGNDNRASITEDINSINDLLSGTGVTVKFDTGKLNQKELKINPEDIASFDTAMQDINTDKDEVNSFINGDIVTARGKLTTKKDALANDIQSLQAQIDVGLSKGENVESLRQKLEAAKANKENIENALAKLDEIEREAKKLVDELVAQKGELLNAKKSQELILDKKYELAKDLKKDIEDTQKDMDKLNEKIRKAIYTDKKSTSAQPVSGWITEYKNKVTLMKGYLKNLGSYLGAEIKNSKGEGSVTLPTSIDAKYLDPLGYDTAYTGDYTIERLSTAENNGVNIINTLAKSGFSKGMSVTLGGITYIYNGEFFEGSDGKKYKWDANQSSMVEQTT